MLLLKVGEHQPEPEPEPQQEHLDVAALDLDKLKAVHGQEEPLPIELLAAGGKVCLLTWDPCLQLCLVLGWS